MKRRLWPLAIGAGYILSIYLLGGLKDRHVLMGCLALLDAYNEKSRKFLSYFFPFMLTGMVYDSMRYFYWELIAGHIHVVEPYVAEKAIFGVLMDGKIVTLNEYFQVHTSNILDFFCGFSYLVFVAEYLSTGFVLYFANKLKLLRAFGWCFFLVNFMGFATYYIYPAAPPWYVTKYGFGPALMHIQATPSAASRFDLLLGTHFFDAMYGNSVDVYGAFPSLHVAYPLLVTWVAFVSKKFRAPALAFYFLMCFSAVYLQHHYILDIILGTLYSATALVIVRAIQEGKVASRIPLQERFMKLIVRV